MEYKKVDQNINNIVNEQVSKLESLFPSVVKDGEVDFQALREELGSFQEIENEKYEFTWAGKKNAKKIEHAFEIRLLSLRKTLVLRNI